jgi:pyruvate,water dikinase
VASERETDAVRPAAAEPLTLALSDVGSSDVLVVGGKGANLGEMLASGFPVPSGFVVTAGAYRRVIGDSGIRERLADITASAATAAPDELSQLARTARDLIADVSVPDDLVAEISTMYGHHCAGERVAVRSSATAEDTAETSFAGMNESFTNVTGQNLLDRVVDCWVSLFGERVVSYRAERGLIDEPAIAVVVQKMVGPADR